MKAATDHLDFGDLGLPRETDNKVREILANWERQRRRLQLAQIRQSANEEGFRRTFRDRDGNGGEVTMRIPPYLYHKLGLFYTYKCWSDADFCKQFLKHYPECRVVSRSEKATIIAPGSFTNSTPRQRKCETKTYNWKN